MIFVSPKIFGQSDVILRDMILAISGLSEVPKKSDISKYLIYN